MKKMLLSLLLAGGVQNSFAMGSCGGGAAQSGGQAAESGFRLEGRIPVIFKDGLVVYLDLQRLRALNSGVLQGSLFTEEGLSRLGEVLEGNPFDMTRFVKTSITSLLSSGNSPMLDNPSSVNNIRSNNPEFNAFNLCKSK